MRASEAFIGLAATAGGRAVASAMGHQAVGIGNRISSGGHVVPYTAGAVVGAAAGVGSGQFSAMDSPVFVPALASVTATFATPAFGAGVRATSGHAQTFMRAGHAAAPALGLAAIATMLVHQYTPKD